MTSQGLNSVSVSQNSASAGKESSKKSTLDPAFQVLVKQQYVGQSATNSAFEEIKQEWHQFQEEKFSGEKVLKERHIQMAARLLAALPGKMIPTVEVVSSKGVEKKPDSLFLLYEAFCLLGEDEHARAVQEYLNAKSNTLQEEAAPLDKVSLPVIPKSSRRLKESKTSGYFLRTLEKIGFDKVLERDFVHPDSGLDEKQFILFNKEKGILFHFETFAGEIGQGSLAYSYGLRKLVDLSAWEERGDRITLQKGALAGYHNLKEGESLISIIKMISYMSERGRFYTMWQSRPIGFYLCHSADWRHIGEGNLGRARKRFNAILRCLPGEVRRAVPAE